MQDIYQRPWAPGARFCGHPPLPVVTAKNVSRLRRAYPGKADLSPSAKDQCSTPNGGAIWPVGMSLPRLEKGFSGP